jgi:trimethylamine:corrinoid methyltransferase-like protein
MSHFYDLPVLGSAVTADAKVSNHQAGAEGMLTGMACALAGADTMLAFGLTDGAQSVSLAKTVLDCDTVGALKRLARPQEMNAAQALVDDLVGVGVGGHFLARRSTRERSRGGELWRPRVWQRQSYEQYADLTLLHEAAGVARELLATHEVPPLSEDVAREVDDVIARYARQVGAPDDRVGWRDGA